MLNVKPANVLTEEELMHREIRFNSDLMGSIMTPTSYRYTEEIIKSHRALNSRNAKLVHENDELMAENEKLNVKKEILKRAVEDIIVSVDFTDAETVRALAFKALEELNHE